MKMFNGELNLFCGFLMAQELDGRNSRMRMRFIKLANETLVEVEEERVRLVNKYSVKDENDKPIVTTNEENGTQTVQLTDPQEFRREYSELLNEEFIVVENEERKPMLDSIKNTVLNAVGPFSGEDAVLYDRWCQVVDES